MHSYYNITNSAIINYEYAVSPWQLSENNVVCTSVTQQLIPPLLICKSSSTPFITLGKTFYYKITLVNISQYPLYVYIYDSIPECVGYNNCSFVKDGHSLSYTELSDWIYMGIMPPCSSTSIYYKAYLVTDYKVREFFSRIYGCYYQIIPNGLRGNWHITVSNNCRLKVDNDRKISSTVF